MTAPQKSIYAPVEWSTSWFLGWYRDVFLKVAGLRLQVKPTGQAYFPPLAADPAVLEDGDAWLNSTAGKFRVRIGGVTVDLN